MGEGSLPPRPEGRGIRDPLRSRSNDLASFVEVHSKRMTRLQCGEPCDRPKPRRTPFEKVPGLQKVPLFRGGSLPGFVWQFTPLSEEWQILFKLPLGNLSSVLVPLDLL